MDEPKPNFVVPWGPARLSYYNETTLVIETHRQQRQAEEQGPGWRIHGVDYFGHVRFVLKPPGWCIESVYLSRLDKFLGDMTDGGSRTVRTELLARVQAWAASPEGHAVLTDGERRCRVQDGERLTERATTLEARAARLREVAAAVVAGTMTRAAAQLEEERRY